MLQSNYCDTNTILCEGCALTFFHKENSKNYQVERGVKRENE